MSSPRTRASGRALLVGSADRLARLLAGLAAASVVLPTLLDLGRPIASDDTWIHLAHGRAFRAAGPWLEGDPFLHTSAGPPLPSAWLYDVASFSLVELAGFQALRVVHVAVALACVALVWSIAARAGRSGLLAAPVCVVFVELAAYRLVQARPHLVTILLTLCIYRLIVEPRRPPGAARVAVASAIAAAMANLHAGFLMGPIVVAAAIAGLLVERVLGGDASGEGLARIRRLVLALGCILLATLLNPSGLAPHLAYFSAGGSTPGLEMVADEWAPFAIWRRPAPGMPPSPLSIVLGWLLLAAFAVSALGRLRRTPEGPAAGLRADPALLGVAAASLVMMLVALRFAWLAVFPLAWIVAAVAERKTRAGGTSGAPALAIAAATVVLAAGFALFGSWTIVRVTMPHDVAAWAKPYEPTKYFAHALWFMQDAGLTGRLHNPYFMGGFVGYHLSPELRASVAGSLNFPPEVLRRHRAIEARDPAFAQVDDGYTALLDAQGVDVYLGTGLPVPRRSLRETRHTTTHLEDEPGWRLVFRNFGSAVHLRLDEDADASLARVRAYYAARGIAFDPDAGLDLAAAVRSAPTWAVQSGVVPVDFAELARLAGDADPRRRLPALRRLADIDACLGFYEQCLDLTDRIRRAGGDGVLEGRREVFCLLHLGRADEAGAALETFDRRHPGDSWTVRFGEAVRRYVAEPDAGRRAAILAGITYLAPGQVARLAGGFVAPEVRVRGR